MSISDWKKRWLYDSKVEIPKTTKWRRRFENINNGISDDIRLGDVWEDLSYIIIIQLEVVYKE